MHYRTSRKMAARKQTHRTVLLRNAIQLFGTRGYHATTVPMIVKATHSSTGSFYSYFRNKEDIFAAALERFAETIADVLYAAIGGAGADPLQQLRAAVQHLVLLMANSPDEARILITESSGLGTRLEKIRRDIIESHAQFVEQVLAQLSTAPPAPDRNIVARCVVASIYESVHHWLDLPPNQRPAPPALATAVADFNARASTAPSAKKQRQRCATPLAQPVRVGNPEPKNHGAP